MRDVISTLISSERVWVPIKRLQLCHSECFYERVLDRQRASHGTGVFPSALGSLSSWSVWQLLWVLTVLCSLDQVSRCSYLCVWMRQHLPHRGPGAQTGSSSTQTNILYQSLIRCVCVCVSVHTFVSMCKNVYLSPDLLQKCVLNRLMLYALHTHHLHWRIGLPRLVKVSFCADIQLALHLVIALDHSGFRFWHFVSLPIFFHVSRLWTNVSSSAKSNI